MRSEDVWLVLDLLAEAGIEVWVHGGWGVDALLGRQTREHDDLDIAVRTMDLDNVRTLLEQHHFSPIRVDGPYNFVVGDPEGRLVDIHSFDHTSTVINSNGVETYGANGLAFEVGGFGGSGVISGRRVACCTPDFEMRSHTGYPLDDDDWKDVQALHHRFGLPIPDDIAKWMKG